MSDPISYDLCEIKEISPVYRLFTEYKTQELMYTATFLILLMYMEEFLFGFQYLLVQLGYARPMIVQTVIFEISDQKSMDSDSEKSEVDTNQSNT